MRSLVWLLLAGCAGGAAAYPPECDDLCAELVGVCAIEAYPSRDSCVQGCAYRAESGADVAGEAACVADAACDLFAVVDCAHAAEPE
jgi:hypothetical protein